MKARALAVTTNKQGRWPASSTFRIYAFDSVESGRMSSSSDEDDVRLRQIQEATSEQLRSAMKEKKNDVSVSRTEKLSTHVSEQPSHHFELQTTPEFRCHVAKKLGEHLDRLLKSVEVTSVLPKQDKADGIRLLSSSTTFAAVDDDACHVSKMPRKATSRGISSSSSSEDNLEKFATVCVSGQSILDGGEGIFRNGYTSRKKETVKLGKRKRQKDKPDVDKRLDRVI